MASRLAPRCFILLSFFLCILNVVTSGTAPDPAASNAEAAGTTHIHFFFHDVTSSGNATAITVVPAVSGSKTSFGMINVIDDKLTEGPDFDSKEIGRAQGLYALASQSDISLLQPMNLVFTDGPYNGSVITVLGRNSASVPIREMSVVGGTGKFRFARGYTQAKLHSFSPSGDHVIVEYNVYVKT